MCVSLQYGLLYDVRFMTRSSKTTPNGCSYNHYQWIHDILKFYFEVLGLLFAWRMQTTIYVLNAQVRRLKRWYDEISNIENTLWCPSEEIEKTCNCNFLYWKPSTIIVVKNREWFYAAEEICECVWEREREREHTIIQKTRKMY